jgi:hypothetical protein
MPTQAHENALSTPYWWCRDDDHPYKGPLRHLKPYLEEVEKKSNDDLAKTFDNINKLVNNPHIDKKKSLIIFGQTPPSQMHKKLNS